jgi:hypothetical protein
MQPGIRSYPVTQQPDDRCYDSGTSVLFLSSLGGIQISERRGLGRWHFQAFKNVATTAI